MDLRKNHKGFSLVELIVVIAIVSILAGISFSLLGHVKLANKEKAVQYVSMSLNKLQTRTMSKAEKQYLYVYRISGQYYTTISATDCSTFNAAVMNSNGAPIGVGMSIYAVDGATKTVIGDNGFAKIAYRKDGSFDTTKTSCKGLSVETDRGATAIKFIAETGKHIIE